MSVSENAITVGVELEFIIRGIPKSVPRDHQFALVAEALGPLGEKLGAQILDMVNSKEYDALPGDDITAAFQIKRDLSIKLDPETPVQRSVEVATPILVNKQWETAVPEMIQLLSSAFKLGFNRTTGLHVHIGIGRSYSLCDLKRVAKAVILFEEQMDTYHPEHRCPRKDAQGTGPSNMYIRSNREGFMLQGLSNSQSMLAIDEVPSVLRLLGVINPPIVSPTTMCRQYRYNLTSVRRFRTVEFRQAAATDDSQKIVEWIGMTIKFIISAISTPDSVFDTWARDGIDDPDVYRRFGVPVPEY